MKVLELFCGTKSFTKVAKARGHETFTIDIEPKFDPDMVADVGQLKVNDLPVEIRHPDVVWASPPCTCFSVAAIYRNWEKVGEQYHPRRQEAVDALVLVKHVLGLLDELKPTAYFIENPRAMLRAIGIMNRLPKRRTVTYCQYGAKTMKPTDIWTNYYGWVPRPMCHPSNPCHESAPRGSKRGVQGIFHNSKENWKGATAANRGVVPAQLCEEIIIACEKSAETCK